MNLYPDQQKTISELSASLKVNREVLLCAVTGWGKAYCSAYMIKSIQDSGKTVQFVAPRISLTEQIEATFKDHGINPDTAHITCSNTMVNMVERGENPTADWLFLDEGHYGAARNDTIIDHYRKQGSFIVPMTATPNKRILSQVQHIVYGPTLSWLIENKRLSEFRLFAPDMPDFSDIDTVAGEYHAGQMDEKMKKDRAIVGNAIKHWKENARGMRTLVFCYSVEHSKLTAERFNKAGVKAAHIDANTSKIERNRIVRALAMDEIEVLCSVELCVFGFDLEAAAKMKVVIQCLVDIAPTQSVFKQKQKNGRGLRYDGTIHYIYDHVGNFRTTCFPDQDIDWIALAAGDETPAGERTIPTRLCPECYYCHSPSPSCPNCGTVYDTNPKKIAEVDGTLKEYTRELAQEEKEAAEIEKKKAQKARRIEEGMCETMQDWLDLAEKRGHKKGWAFMRHKKRKNGK